MVLPDRSPLPPSQAVALLERILQRGGLSAAYQPILDLHTHEVVAYEALARGPAGPLQSPAALFGTAERAGLVPHLEWACRRSAVEGALAARLGAVTSLFVNVESSIVGTPMPPELVALMRTASRELRIVLELTERDLVRRPADLLRLVRDARESWWGVALDDVGAEPASLAVMPFVRPDVVKLDMRLVQEDHEPGDDVTVRAVRVYSERTGSTVLAEGIETEEHERRARELGATLGQGWLYGRPGPLPARRAGTGTVRLLDPAPDDGDATPFDVVAASTPVRTCRRSELALPCRQLEQQALGPAGAVLLSCFGAGWPFDAATAARYARLSLDTAFTGVVGLDLPAGDSSRTRYSALDDADPLATERVVTVVSPAGARALVARAVQGSSGAADPPVEFCVSDDRAVVLRAARLLMERTLPR